MYLSAQHGVLNCLQPRLERGEDTSIMDGAHDGTPEDWYYLSDIPDAVAILHDAK